MPDAPIAAGILFVDPVGDILLLRRASSDSAWPGHWDLPGGKGEEGEDANATAAREAEEEIGKLPKGERKLLSARPTPRGMVFHTFVQPVEKAFIPTLDHEHTGYAWAPLHQLPSPVHPGVTATLQERFGPDQIMMPEHGRQLFDWARGRTDSLAHDGIAFDRDSVRSIDQDGHLRVETAPISKANVCPYWGREIPEAETLGLDADRIYQLYRDPAELAKAATSFAGKPLLLIHTPVSAEDHPREVVVGAVGDDVDFADPYLKAPLSIWDGEAIGLIQSGRQKELSSSYRYRADMTPGVAPDGSAFDGVMRDILANHVALVEKGRAGPDVVVGDEALKPGTAEPELKVGDSKGTIVMANAKKLSRMAGVAYGAIISHVAPLLATDAKVDLTGALAGISGKNFKSKHAEIIAGVTKATEGKLAKDQKLDGLDKVLLALDENCDPQEAMDEDETDEEREAKEKAAADKKAKDEAEEDEKRKKDEDEKKAEDKKAMDAAINDAIAGERKRQQDIRDAEEAVRPWVGKIVAQDSAAAVYRTALAALGVQGVDALHADALPHVLKAQPLPGAQSFKPSIAMDAARVSAFHERFPGAKGNPTRVI